MSKLLCFVPEGQVEPCHVVSDITVEVNQHASALANHLRNTLNIVPIAISEAKQKETFCNLPSDQIIRIGEKPHLTIPEKTAFISEKTESPSKT